MRAEEGADRVAAVLDHAVIGAVNLAEVNIQAGREEIAIRIVREWIDASSSMSDRSIASREAAR